MTPTTTAVPVTYGMDASLKQFSVDSYQKMIETGILTKDDNVELLENWVVLKMSKGPPHEGTIDLITHALGNALPAGWRLRSQQTIALSDSQPEPDFTVVRGGVRDYLTRHPGPADIGLVVEVAHSSLLRDQRDKARIYARAGIPGYWIVNLIEGRIEVHTRPSGATASPTYTSVVNYHKGDNIPLVLDGNTIVMIPVADLLP